MTPTGRDTNGRHFLAGVALAAVSLIGISARAQDPQPALTLVGIDVTGIHRHTQSEVVALSGLTFGQTLQPAAASAAAARLADTGLFSQVTYRYQTNGSNLRLTFDVAEERWTIPVVLDNFIWIPDDELTRELRQGVPTFDGTAPGNAKAVDFLARELQRLLDRRGIRGRVEYSQFFNMATGAKSHVFVVTDAGDATRVCAVRFEGASSPIVGELGRAAAVVGSQYSRQYFEGLLRGTLTQIYRRRGYLRAEFAPPRLAIGAPAGCSGVAVTLRVSEGLKYTSDRVRWSGNAALSSNELNRLLALGNSEVADPEAIQRGLARVHAAYESRGYPGQSSSFSVQFNDATKHATLTIVITEGRRSRSDRRQYR